MQIPTKTGMTIITDRQYIFSKVIPGCINLILMIHIKILVVISFTIVFFVSIREVFSLKVIGRVAFMKD